MVHAATRKKDLVDKLHSIGLSISYSRMLQISTDLANDVCAHYGENRLVCPPQLHRMVFTTAAVDNLDHNPSSNTAKEAFHGTAVSLTNHITHDNAGTPQDIRRHRPGSRKKGIPNIPQRYMQVPPAGLKNKSRHPNCVWTSATIAQY
jgi:hypothetical protein